MNANNIHSVLLNTFNQDAGARHQAENQLREAERCPGFVSTIFQVVCCSDVAEEVRQAGAIRLKNTVTRRDWNSEESLIQEDEKTLLRNNLLTAVVETPRKLRVQLLECMRWILQYDYPERWPGIVDQMTAQLATNQPNNIYGGLSALRVLAKRFEWKSRDERSKYLWPILTSVFPSLGDLFTHLNSQDTTNSEVCEMQKLLCKIFWSSCGQSLPEFLLKDAALCKKWLDAMLHVLGQPCTETERRSHQWKVKKWVMHNVSALLEKYGNPRRNSTVEQQFGQAFLDTYAVPLCMACLALVQAHQGGTFVSPQVLTLCLTFLDVAIGYRQTYVALQPHLETLLLQFCFPLLCFNKEDAELWGDNPDEYIRKLNDPCEDVYNPRVAATNIVLHACKPSKPYHDKTMLNKMLGFLHTIMNKYNTEGRQDAPTKDGALYAVGALHGRLRGKDEYVGMVEDLLVAHAFPEFTSPHGFLRAKSIYVVSQYAKMKWKNPAHFQASLNAVMSLMRDPELPVRVQAAEVLRPFIKHPLSADIIKPVLAPLVTQLFALMNEMDNERTIDTLEVIIEKYGEDMAPAATQLVKQFVEHFMKVAPDVPEDDDEAPATIGQAEKAQEEMEEQVMAAAACLRALSTLLSAVAGHPEVYVHCEEFFIPLLTVLLQPTKSEYFDDAMELMSRFTFLSKSVSPALWSLFSLLVTAYKGWVPDYLSSMLAAFDNYICRDPKGFAEGTCVRTGQRYVAMLTEVMTLCMSNEDRMNEWHCCPKLMESGLQHCKDSQEGMAPFVPMWFDLIINLMRTQKDMSTNFKILCCSVFADGLYFNPQLTVGYLVDRQVLQPVFGGWMDVIPKYDRKMERKVATLGICSLLSAMNHHGTGWLPSEYFTPEFVHTLIGICVKLVLQCYSEATDEDGETASESDEEEEGSDADDFDGSDSDDIDDEADITSGLVFAQAAEKEQFEELIMEAKECTFSGSGAKHLMLNDDLLLQDDDYESVIDDIEEAIVLRDVMQHGAQVHGGIYNKVMTDLSQETRTALEQAVQRAEGVIKKRMEDAQSGQ